MFTTILVPVDGSKPAQAALELAVNVALKYDAGLVLLHVVAHRGSELVPPDLRELERVEHVRITERDLLESTGKRIVAKAEDRARSLGARKVETVVATGNPARVIVDEAKARGANLIVMGRRGLGDLGGLFMGSVTHKVSQLANCPCLTVP
jgi:nucleotide-binding universal stress UspA family protein